MKRLIIDPPSGWKYGFPKPIPEEIIYEGSGLEDWLIEQGYPESEIHLAKYSRYWESNTHDN